MTLNIDNKGNIYYEGRPFLFAAFCPKDLVDHKPIHAQQVPYPFTFDTGSGIATYPAKAWLLFWADGTVTVALDSDFQANWKIVSAA
jgi:hypothetical protein